VETRKIGSLNVSLVGVGCNNVGFLIDETRAKEVIDSALDAGVNFFDTADSYGFNRSEEMIGRVLAGRRSDVIIATKFGQPVPGQGNGAAPQYVKKACEASLKRLGTDYIDLYQLHIPDPKVPIAETLGALDDLVKAGHVREVGCSNFSAEQLGNAEAAAKRGRSARFVSVQNEYSLLHREPEARVLPECARLAIAFLPYLPLKGGLLTGKYRKDRPMPEDTRMAKVERYRKFLTHQNLNQVERLIDYARIRGHTVLDLAVSWLLAHGVVASVIAGATSAAQVRANVRAANWRLGATDLAEIDRLLSSGGSMSRWVTRAHDFLSRAPQ